MSRVSDAGSRFGSHVAIARSGFEVASPLALRVEFVAESLVFVDDLIEPRPEFVEVIEPPTTVAR